MNRYKEIEGIYLDQETGLVWKKYPEKGMYTFEEALALENSEWRLPTIKELYSIVDIDEYNPATKLPNHISDAYWSCSPYTTHSYLAWFVNFNVGSVNSNSRSTSRCVRLIKR